MSFSFCYNFPGLLLLFLPFTWLAQISPISLCGFHWYIVYMEQWELSEDQAMNLKCSCGKFKFDTPLLLTRQIDSCAGEDLSCKSLEGLLHSVSDRVPFSWEQVPSKPINLERDDIHDENENLALLKWWRHWSMNHNNTPIKERKLQSHENC